MVFKPADLTPLTAMRVVRIFAQAGLPAGVLNLVIGCGRDAGDELVQHPARARDLVHRIERGRQPALCLRRDG